MLKTKKVFRDKINIEYLEDKKIIERFSSNRNQVYLLNNNSKLEVIKIFNDINDYTKEKTINSMLNRARKNEIKQDFHIPDIIEDNCNEAYIVYNYIKGNKLLNVFELYEKSNETDQCVGTMIDIFCWLDKFHNILTKKEYVNEMYKNNLIDKEFHNLYKDEVISLYDINFKNFIINNGQVYGYDYEYVKVGRKVDEYVKFLAYLLTYDPILTKFKRNVYKLLLNEVEKMTNKNKDEIVYLTKNELKIIEKRRGLNIGDL